MLLAVDVGNSNIVIGCFDQERLAVVLRLKTDLERTPDEYAGLMFSLFERKLGSGYSFERCIISSVVPPLTPDIVNLIHEMFGVNPIIVGPGVKTGLRINISEPASVGADRVVNALAAKNLFGTPALVVDFGTATSIDFVSREGEYEGGVIVPGVKIALDSLVSHTAKLPRIELTWPESVIGKSTVGAMQSGAVVGYACMIDGLVERIQSEVGPVDTIITTGGLGELFSDHCETSFTAFEPDLTLKGLQIIANLNWSSK